MTTIGSDKGGPLEKLLLALSLVNTYSDLPNCSREELHSERQLRHTKLSKVHWPGLDNIADYFFKDENENYYLHSIDDDLATIILSENCLHFRV